MTKTKSEINQRVILKEIFRQPGISRVDIARRTGITPATITNIVTTLIKNGLVTQESELAPTPSANVGRRKVGLFIAPSQALVLGIEFTEKGIVCCLTNLIGTVLEKYDTPFSAAIPKNINTVVSDQINKLLNISNYATKVVAIGIAVPGHVNEEETLIITNNKLWKEFNPHKVKQRFQQHYPVYFENNVHCMGLAYELFDNNHSDSNLFFHLAYGMVFSHLINGELVKGANYSLGEIGHTIVVPDGEKCECGKYGCLQTVASEAWLLKKARIISQNISDTVLRDLVPTEKELTIQHLSVAYDLGDPHIRNLLNLAIHYLAISLSNLFIVLNIEQLILHGEFFDNAAIKQAIVEQIAHNLQFIEEDNFSPNIQIKTFSSEDGALGACALAITNYYLAY